MFVTEHLDRAVNPLFSYEIIPPQRGRSADQILDVIQKLVPYEPPFIDVTAHPPLTVYEERDDDTVVKRVRRKRPGTISLCGIIQNRFNIDTVPHLLCNGATRELTEDQVIELNFLGIRNVLAIRGDETNAVAGEAGSFGVNHHASDLVEQLNELRQGKYLEELEQADPVELCVGVAGYPEKHSESPNLDSDIRNLKQKVDAGADYIVTQMFFDNSVYYAFVAKCREASIKVPIIPGLKVLSSKRQLQSIPKNFHVDMPEELVHEIEASPKHVRKIGVEWAIKQSRDLLENNIKCLHFFVLNDAATVVKVVSKLK